MANIESRDSREEPFEEARWLTPWAPARELGGLSRMMDELFSGTSTARDLTRPPLDVVESDDAYAISVELPGVERSDITVECKDRTLAIRGEKKSEREEETERARILERRYGAFSRSLLLPVDADTESVKANFKEGVLKVQINKKPQAKSRAIAIKG